MKILKILMSLYIVISCLLSENILLASDNEKVIERGDLGSPEKSSGFYAKIRNPKFTIDDIAATAELDLKSRNFFYNGAIQKGKLKNEKSAYITLSFYKANKYVISIGADYNIKTLHITLYNASTHEEIFTNEIIQNSYKSIIITPKVNGNYYLKITSETEKQAGGNWMFLYGFKPRK